MGWRAGRGPTSPHRLSTSGPSCLHGPGLTGWISGQDPWVAGSQTQSLGVPGASRPAGGWEGVPSTSSGNWGPSGQGRASPSAPASCSVSRGQVGPSPPHSAPPTDADPGPAQPQVAPKCLCAPSPQNAADGAPFNERSVPTRYWGPSREPHRPCGSRSQSSALKASRETGWQCYLGWLMFRGTTRGPCGPTGNPGAAQAHVCATSESG